MLDPGSPPIAEEELQERTRLNQILLDSMPCVALLLRPSTRKIVASNQAAVELGAVPGTQCFATWGQREDPCPWCLAPALWGTAKPQHLEVEADGIFWDAYWAPVGPDLYLHYAFDISERKQAEKEIARLASFPQLNPNPVVEVDLGGNVTFINPAAQEAVKKGGGQGAEFLLPPDLAEILQQAREAGETRFYRELAVGETVFAVHIYFVLHFQVARLFLIDITQSKRAEEEMRLNEARLASLLRISQYPTTSIQELLDYTLEECITLTGSKVGYIYFYDEASRRFTLNTWSKGVMKECTIGQPPTVYQLENTGIWGEAVRQARPIIVNDFQAPHPLKRGYPEGHAKLFKYLTIPVFSGDLIVAVVGVANKETDYDQTDVRQLTLMMDAVWKIIERQKAAQALQESEEQYRFLVNQIPAVAFTGYADWSVDFFDRKIEALTGFSKEEFDSRKIKWSDLVLPEDLEGARQAFIEALKGDKTYAREYRIRKKNGEIRWIQARGGIFCDEAGKVDHVSGVFFDITERKRAEEALRVSEKKYRLLVNQLPAVVFKGYADWSVDFLDRKIEELTGYSTEDFESRRVKWCDVIHEDDFDYAQEIFREALKGNKSYVREHRIRRKDGKIRWVQCRGQISCDAQGKVEHISGVSFDITARKRAEEALRDNEQFLTDIFNSIQDGLTILDSDLNILRVNQPMDQLPFTPPLVGRKCYTAFHGRREPCEVCATQEVLLTGKPAKKEVSFTANDGSTEYAEIRAFPLLNRATGQVQQVVEYVHNITERKKAEAERLRFSKLESLATLAGGIAHDFNNILTVIMGNISLATLNLQTEELGVERLKEAERACIQAQGLARQLLTFAKGGAPIKKLVSLEKIVTQSGAFVSRGSMVRCEFSFSKDLWAADADPGQIAQVFQNLVINATQAMPTGGIINIRGENLVVEAKSVLPLNPGKYVKISIQDQGVGMPADYLPKIFDPYFTTKQSGSGLGLATAYSIIKNHHGHISVESKLGEGTVFIVYLPASEKNLAPQREEGLGLASGKGRILVMDDEEMVLQVLGKMLDFLGYEAEFARDGEQALKMFTAARQSGRPFDAVILDLTIPGGMGGKEAMEKLLEIDPRVKTIVSSGYFDDPIMAEFVRYGFSGVIAKPYRVTGLSKVLKKVLM